MRTCKCGCGGEIKNNRWEYLRGHKPIAPAADARKTESDPEETPVVEEAVETAENQWTLTVTLSDSQIELMWATLTPREKAAAIVYALENQATVVDAPESE